MKIIKQIGIIFTVCWLSLVVEKLLPLAFPASVIGMILLFAWKYGIFFRSCRCEHYELL